MENDTNGNGYFKGNINARVAAVEENVKTILTNHLPHIQEHLEKQDTKLVWILTTLIIVALGLASNLALSTLRP